MTNQPLLRLGHKTRRGFDISFALLAHLAAAAVYVVNATSDLAFKAVRSVRRSLSFNRIENLQFLPFTNGTAKFLALVDGGAQLNILDHSLIPKLTNFKRTDAPRSQVWSFNRPEAEQSEWIDLDITLPNAQTITVPFAVITDNPNLIILGMSFNKQVDGVQDYRNAILKTSLGTFALIERTPVRNYVAEVKATTAKSPIIPLQKTNLTETQLQQCQQLLEEFRDLWGEGRIGKVAGITHTIQLTDERPINHRPRQITEEQKKAVKVGIDEMLAAGVIQKSNSPYANETVMVLKKTKDWRFCGDYRDLNQKTIPDKYPLPRINDLIRAIHGSYYFSTVDLKSGFWQIPMEPSSVKYTAFRCFLGLYEYLTMPFGLRNAPATFQRMMDYLFGDLRFAGVLTYLDDILVHAATFDEALGRLRIVFLRLRDANLTINLPKCSFFPATLTYLGQVIENGQLKPDPQKVEVLDRLKTPKAIHDIRSLLGFFGYYSHYIKNYANIMEPIYQLLRGQKNTKRSNAITAVQWTPDHQAAVDEARRQLIDAALHMPAAVDTYQVETDASNTAIAAILSCYHEDRWKPVEFYSKTLTQTERNWPTREREAYAIVRSIQRFHHYLWGRPFTVVTDHESLKWIMNAKCGKISRWASILSDYPMTVIHRRGNELIHVDYLTRNVQEEPDGLVKDHMCFYTTALTPLPTLKEILEAQAANNPPLGKGFLTHKGTIYYHGLIWVPPELRTVLIAACHSVAPFHHPGIKKTKRLIQRSFNWPALHHDVAKYLQSCLYCRRARSGKERLQGLQRIHPSTLPFEQLYMDLWQATYDGTTYHVLTMIDQATKWVECVVVPDQTARITARAFLVNWVYRYGTPKRLVTDRGTSFCNALMDYLTTKLGITRLTATPYHPEGNAVIESFHRTLNNGLRHINQKAMPFTEALEMVLFGYRATIHSTTGTSPSHLTLGQDPQLPPDNDWRMESTLPMQERLKFLSNLRLEVQLRAYQTTLRQIQEKNKGRTTSEFELHQLVLCHMTAAERLRYGSASYKALPRWTLPHRVVRVLSSKQSAMVKCLITGNIRQVHLQDVRFVLPPEGPVQKEEWQEIVLQEAVTMHDPESARNVVALFFEALEEPQYEPTLEEEKAIVPTRKKTKRRSRCLEGE